MQIKKFIFRLVLFGLIAFPLVAFESLYGWVTGNYKKGVNGSEIYTSISKSKNRKKVKKLLIGDSVGKQLYDNETWNNDIYSLTCNQAISLAGQFILLQNFIDANKDQLPDEVLLIINPQSLRNDLDQVYTYHYFLKPFYTDANQQLITPLTRAQIHKVPLYYTAQLPLIVNTNWSPAYDPKPDHRFNLISPVSNDYLIRIRELCASKKIPFKILGPPVKMAAKAQTLAYTRAGKEFAKCGLSEAFRTYFDKIEFMPDSLFQDHIHFKKEFIPKDYFGLER